MRARLKCKRTVLMFRSDRLVSMMVWRSEDTMVSSVSDGVVPAVGELSYVAICACTAVE